jgi:mono/diheme cytochrome c family protein
MATRLNKHSLSLLVLILVPTIFGGCGAETEPATEEEAFLAQGRRVYTRYCMSCHQADGGGLRGIYPPLQQTDWVLGDEGRLIRLVLDGVQGPIEVLGETYNQLMIPHGFLSDEEVASVLTFVRQNFGNDAPPVSPAQVQAVREGEPRPGIWQASALEHATGIPGE